MDGQRSAPAPAAEAAAQALMAALRARDEATAVHARMVVLLAGRVALRLGAELLRSAGTQLCPTAVGALLAVLDDEQELPQPPGAAPPRRSAVASRSGGRVESELLALMRLSSAVASTHLLDDVIEVVAEECRTVLRAASVSISSWELEENRLRT